MKRSIISFKIASWTLLIGGFVHTAAALTTPQTERLNDLMFEMKNFTAQMLGSEVNMYDFHQGFSFMMGLLLFGYGAVNLVNQKNYSTEQLPTNSLILNSILTFVAVLLSIKYFFIVPVLLTGIPFIGYTIALILNLKQK